MPRAGCSFRCASGHPLIPCQGGEVCDDPVARQEMGWYCERIHEAEALDISLWTLLYGVK